MSEKQSDEHIIPIVAVGEYDSATRDKGLSSAGVKNNTSEGSPSIAGVENNSKKLSVFEKMGQVAAKAVHVIREAYAAERIDVDAKRPENDEGVMERLGFPGNTENQTNNSGALEGSADTSKSSANKPEADDDEDGIPAFLRRRKNAGEGTKSTSGEQASSANQPKAKEGKVNTPDKSVDTSGDKPNYYSLDDLIYEDVPKNKANEILRKAYGTAHEPKTLDELIDNPNISKNVVNEILDRVYGSSPEKSDQKDGVNSAKGGQESSTAGSSKDKQTKDLNSEDATYVDDTPTEEIDSFRAHEVATNLKIARERFAKASIAVETHFFKEFFGGKKRQKELEAATEQLKQSELEYMRLKFADKIEASKQDPEKQAELAAEIGQAAFASMQETSKKTSEKYDDMLDDRGKFKKAAAKVGKWFNKGGKIAQWFKLGGAGFAVGTVASAVSGLPITTTTLVVTELAVAGAVKQNILEERRGEDRMDDTRRDYLDSSFVKDMADKDADYVMSRAVDMSVDELKDVSVKRQEDLYRRIGSGLAKYAIGFGLGGLVGSHFAGDWGNSTHATGAESHNTTTAPSQPGSEQIPQHPSGAPSIPDTSNFNSYNYPWDWAVEKFGDANAMDQLHNLADKAMANGHTVEWFNNPDGSVWMKVDGSSVTKDVLKVLNKYA